jgi:uncharacterized low-complexity protein
MAGEDTLGEAMAGEDTLGEGKAEEGQAEEGKAGEHKAGVGKPEYSMATLPVAWKRTSSPSPCRQTPKNQTQ